MRKGIQSRTALKFQSYQMERMQQNMRSTFTTFRIHTLYKSDAQIILPQNYHIVNKNDELIFLISSGNINFYAQLSQNSLKERSNCQQISILHNLVSIAGINVDSSGSFKGQMKCLGKEEIPQSYRLEYVQILVKNMYLSRRDQYKVLKNLKDRVVHVYTRKTLYFDRLELQVTNMLHSNQQVCRTGVITRNTKIIFRSSCSKYTMLIEIAKEMFQFNEEKQIYLEKTINFLLVFFQRNNYFSNTHRIEIILFARLFYPQFRTLTQAYEYLMEDEDEDRYNQDYPSTKNISNASTMNYAVALQKDYKNRIFQDVYRIMLWSGGSISGFRQRFWQKVSQFMFTINWPGEESYAKYIRKSIDENMVKEKDLKKSDKLKIKIKPFLHRLPCQLTYSRETCFFEAISLIAEQYKHHYYFRSLSETGNAITIVSAGKSFYTVDLTTYKMAKSNIYLTNINVIHINLKRNQPQINVQIIEIEKRPRYHKKQDIKKIKNLLNWCIEQDAYKSPTMMTTQFADDFQMKSMIFPQQLKEVSDLEKQMPKFMHSCQKSIHYVNEEQKNQPLKIKLQSKFIQWIAAYYINEKAFTVHNFFYEGTNFQMGLIKNATKIAKTQQKQFETFDRDLSIIINKKCQHTFLDLTNQSQTAKKMIKYVQKSGELVDGERGRPDIGIPQRKIVNEKDVMYEMKYLNKFFQIASLEDQGEKGKNKKEKKAKSNSNSNTPEKRSSNIYNPIINNPSISSSNISNTGNIQLYISSALKGNKNYRKGSEAIFVSEGSRQEKEGKGRQGNRLSQVNIFQETCQKRQYTSKSIQNLQIRKQNSHNKQRLKKNYRESNIHYMMTYFNQTSYNYLTEFVKRAEARTEEEKIIQENFQMEKQWKNIIFPILTPIYTNYRADLKLQQMHSKYSQIGQTIVQQQICKHLMQNFQIEKQLQTSQITMSKGHVHVLLSVTTLGKVVLFQAINQDKQKRIVPKMFYRYMCYEEKDYRFGAKSLLFSDENYYMKEKKAQEKKSVKLLMLEQSARGDGSNFKEFMKMMRERYRGIRLEVGYAQFPKQTYTVSINLVEDMKNLIYRSEKIDVTFDTNYNPDCLYQIIVQWQCCCATYVNQFIQSTISYARKNRIITYQGSKTNAFDTRWTTATIGEIIFRSRFAMEMLEDWIIVRRDWLWDREGYYMDRNGQAFVRFNHNKLLIEWYDNIIDKSKWKKMQGGGNRNYENFFVISTVYDFLGEIIDSFTNVNSRKSSLALST